MSQNDRFAKWLRRLSSPTHGRWFSRKPLPPITFPNIGVVDRPPPNKAVEKNVFYFVSRERRPKWALFQCPCGCGEVVTLSLQRTHRPYWVVRKSRNRRANLLPSVWRDVGCMSHFWIHDGRVYWCDDSGSSPYLRQSWGEHGDEY